MGKLTLAPQIIRSEVRAFSSNKPALYFGYQRLFRKGVERLAVPGSDLCRLFGNGRGLRVLGV